MDPPESQEQPNQQQALYQQWREHQERKVTPIEPSSTPLITLLCKFNGGCSEGSLHRQIRKKLAENLAYLQELAGFTEAEAIATGNGQCEFNDEQEYRSKTTTIVTTHLKNTQFEIFPSKLTHLGADGTFALRGFLRITVR